MSGPVTRRVPVRGLELAVHRWPAEGRLPVFFLHGFLDHALSFMAVAQALDGEIDIIAPDFRGHGESDWVGDGGYYHFPDYFSDLARIIDFLKIDRFGLVGHSMGGTVSVGLCSLFRERIDGIVLLEGIGPPKEPMTMAPDRLRMFSKALSAEELLGGVEDRRTFRRTMPNVEEAARRMCQLNERLSLARALSLARTATEPTSESPGAPVCWRFDPLHRTPSARPFNAEEYEALLGEVTMPVLALYGEDSSFRTEELDKRHAILKDLRCAAVADAGHNIHHDRPAVVSELVRMWFTGDRAGPLPEGVRGTQSS